MRCPTRAALIAAALAAPHTPADAGVLETRCELAALLGTAAQTEDFETLDIPDGSAVAEGLYVLDEHAIVAGQGPGLVRPGVEYIINGVLQWNARGYSGLRSRCITSWENNYTVRFDRPARAAGLDLVDFEGFGHTVTVRVFDGAGRLAGTITRTVSGPAPVFVGFDPGDAGIARLELSGNALGYGPIIDNLTWAEPRCDADFNRDGRVDADDVFDFLNAYFAGC